MKLKSLFVGMSIFALLSAEVAHAATVTGNAFLDNSANHSNIEIQFIAASPSAVTTSGFTDSSGAFSTSVVPGVYNITYVKAGYQSHAILSVVIATNLALGNVTLSSVSTLDVSGNVEGTWVGNMVYRVVGNITVPIGKSLIIEPGAEVRFIGFYTFTVDGKMDAQGTQSSPILFTSGNVSKARGDWGGITTRTTGTDTTRFNYCTIEYGASNSNSSALIWSQGNTVVTNCKVRASAFAGVYNQYGGYLKISDTEISDCYYYGLISGSTAVGAVANRCNVHHVDLIGVSNSFTLSRFTNGRVSNTGYQGFQNFGECNIERNIFFSNTFGVFVAGGTPLIKNNTFLSNGTGVGFYSSGGWNPSAIITSNIFYQNSGYAINCEGIYGPQKIEYNLFYGNPQLFNLSTPIGFGQILTTNVGGYPADTYYNIFQNPQFVSTNAADPNFVLLGASSPAIHAGDPQYRFCDNSVVDCGVTFSSRCSQTISFEALSTKSFTDAPFDLTATSTSFLMVTFASSNPLVATVTGKRVTIVGTGETTITATQTGDDAFLAATPVPQTLAVIPGNQTITFNSLPDKTINDPVVTLNATASSSLAVQYSASSNRVAILNNQLTLLGIGRVTVTASQPGNSNFNEAAEVQQSFCINPLPPVISVTAQGAGEVTMTSSASENLWYWNGVVIPSEESDVLVATRTGVYSAVSRKEDCLSAQSNTIDFVITGGLDEILVPKKMVVYPNPSRNEVHLDLNGFDPSQPVDVSVYDLLGRSMETNKGVQGPQHSIQVNLYPQGMYVIRATQGTRVSTASFLKQ